MPTSSLVFSECKPRALVISLSTLHTVPNRVYSAFRAWERYYPLRFVTARKWHLIPWPGIRTEDATLLSLSGGRPLGVCRHPLASHYLCDVQKGTT